MPRLSELSLTAEDIITLYNDCLSVDQVAEDTGISTRTIRKYLNERGIRAQGRRERKPRYETGAFACWLREHPDIVLPRSVTKIAEMTGIKRSTVNSHLIYRQRKVYNRIMEKMPGYIKTYKKGEKLKLTHFTLPFPAIRRISLTVDRFSLIVGIIFHMKDGTIFRFKTTEDEINRRISSEEK